MKMIEQVELKNEKGIEFDYSFFSADKSREWPIFTTLHQKFDLKNFKIARKPIVVGIGSPYYPTVESAKLRILDMPIKFPGSNYRIPMECSGFDSIIKTITLTETILNKYIDEYYAYLTIDCGPVFKGDIQRNGGAHVDGFQGARIKEKVVSDRSYICVSDFPTTFYVQPWKVDHLDMRKHNFFLEFDRQKKARNIWRPKAKDIVLMDAYTVHEAGIATETKHRSFVRLSYSVRKFDRKGNTHNPLFNYNWKMVKRDISKELK